MNQNNTDYKGNNLISQSQADQIKCKLWEYIRFLKLDFPTKKNAFTCPVCGGQAQLENPSSWFCKFCGNSGDIFDIAKKIEHLDKIQAVKEISKKYGIKDTLLHTISAQELLSIEFKNTKSVITRLMPRGTYIFAGASKIGKSWMVLWFANQISLGQPVWDFETSEGEVLYLSLEDTPKRLQERLIEIAGQDVGTIRFATQASIIGNGLEEQLTGFLIKYPKTNLVIIDTLQKIREIGGDKYGYANDYDVIGRIKKIADSRNVTFLIVHHTRKESDDDSFNTISGTTGLLGCADGAFILMKNKRMEQSATFEATGRDIADIKLNLKFNSETKIWQMVSQDDEELMLCDDPILVALSKLITKDNSYWKGTASDLLEKLKETKISFEAKPNTLSRKLNSNSDLLLTKYNISYSQKREENTKLIILKWSACDMCDNSDILGTGG